MKVIISDFSKIKPFKKATVLCLGYFDGVHLGHLSLINKAKETNQDVAVLTFDRLNKPTAKGHVLTTVSDRLALLEKAGVDVTILVSFSDKIKNIEAEQFIDILNKFKVTTVFCGPDYRFGKNALGDTKLLKYGIGRHFKTTIVEQLFYRDYKIATSHINQYLEYGNVNLAYQMLGRHYSIKGHVIKGLGNGTKLGFPTANIALSGPYMLPHNGVYAVNIKVNQKTYFGMASIGFHPTISPLKEKLLEVHIFDFNQRIYQKKVEVFFLQFIRFEQKFASVEQLVTQMTIDEGQIRPLKPRFEK